MPKLPFRRKKENDEAEREEWRRINEENEKKRAALEAQILQHERQEHARRERENSEKAEQKRREQEELHRVQQMENQRQEAETRRLEQLRMSTPETLRRLRELIRARYELDLYIWSCKGVQKTDQQIVIRDGQKADAILKEIRDIVNTWEESEWDPAEWKVARMIKERLYTGEQRIWEGNPPWNERAF